jgi:hypothetical protein
MEFTIMHAFEFRLGGVWRFTMHSAEGTGYPAGSTAWRLTGAGGFASCRLSSNLLALVA